MKKVSEPQILVGWLFGDKRPSGTVFQSISGRLTETGGKKREIIDGKYKCPNNLNRTYCKRSRPLPYYNPN